MPQYYPKSQIQPNLYTNGDEFFLINTQTPYTGYYYKLSTGKKYTGKNPDEGTGIELIPNTTLGGNPTDPLPNSTPDSIRTTENLSDFRLANPSTLFSSRGNFRAFKKIFQHGYLRQNRNPSSHP